MALRQMHDRKDNVPYLLFLAATIAVFLSSLVGWSWPLSLIANLPASATLSRCKIVIRNACHPRIRVESDSCPVGSPVRWPPVPPPRRGESITAVDEARRIAANIDKLP